MAHITSIEKLGSLVGVTIDEDGQERTVFGDTRMTMQALEGLQAEADGFAQELGLGPRGFLDMLEVEVEVASWGGLESITAVGYNDALAA